MAEAAHHQHRHFGKLAEQAIETFRFLRHHATVVVGLSREPVPVSLDRSLGTTPIMTAVPDDSSIAQAPLCYAQVAKADPGKSRRRFQMTLADFTVWVLGVAIALFLAIRWNERWHGPKAGRTQFDSPATSLVVLMLLVGLSFRVAGQVVRLALRRLGQGGNGPTPSDSTRFVSILWRSMATALIIAITAEIAGTLGPVRPKLPFFVVANNSDLREDLLPLCGLVMVIGLLAGMQPPAPLSRRPVRPAWFSIGLAATLGIGVIASYMTIWHLIIVALEAISNAMQAVADVHHYPLGQRSSLAARINDAGHPAALAVAATLATAEWVARDLRRASSITRDQSLTRFERLYRFATFTAMVLAAAHLVRATIPHIHKWLSGVWFVIGWQEVAWVVAAFATLSAGIVARAIGRSSDVFERSPSRVSRWSAQAGASLFLLSLIFAAIAEIAKVTRPDYLYARVGADDGLIGRASDLCAWMQGTRVPIILWCPPAIWATYELLRRHGPQSPDRATCFDATLDSRRSAGRFLTLWAALTTVCVCGVAHSRRRRPCGVSLPSHAAPLKVKRSP